MGMFRSVDISASGMSAQRFRMDVIAQNVANQDTTRTADGQPYRRRIVTFQERNTPFLFSDWMAVYQQQEGGTGVRATSVQDDTSTDYKLVYDPSHPDADGEGYVRYPNVDIERELTDMVGSVRAYEANVTALNNFKNIAMKALEIGR